MKLKRNILLALLMGIIAVTSLAGCEKKVMWIGNDLPGHTKAKYKTFSGTKRKSIKADKGKTITINYESKVDKGTLSMKVFGPDEKEVTELELNTKGTEEIKCEQSGKYILVIEGDETGGSFDVEWEVK